MAIVQNPLIGRTRKQTGGQVFSTIFGQNVMRSKPASYRDANSESQSDRRAIMKMLSKSLASVKLALTWYFEHAPIKMAPYSKAISQFMEGYPVGTVVSDPTSENITLGSGSYSAPTFTAVADLSVGTVEVSWDPDEQNPATPSDAKASVIGLNITKSTGSSITEDNALSVAVSAIPLPFGTEVGDKIMVGLAFSKTILGIRYTSSSRIITVTVVA